MPRQMRLTAELVSRVPSSVPDPGPMPIVAMAESENYHERTVQEVMETRPNGSGIWVFAYGSLIWKPRFSHVDQRRATIEGWTRSFCLGPDTRYRGNPDAPGFGLSIKKGGNCTGVAYLLPDENLAHQLTEMLKTEPPIPPAWIETITENGPITCLANISLPEYSIDSSQTTEDEIADRIAVAVGMLGSMAEYLFNTVVNLEQLGIHDPYLWRMQDMVAERLERLPPA